MDSAFRLEDEGGRMGGGHSSLIPIVSLLEEGGRVEEFTLNSYCTPNVFLSEEGGGRDGGGIPTAFLLYSEWKSREGGGEDFRLHSYCMPTIFRLEEEGRMGGWRDGRGKEFRSHSYSY